MAVVVQCYHCNTILELDEGFRGGVCRCSTCGSLLQVPKAATAGAPKARPAAPGAVVSDGQRPANPNVDAGLSRGQFDPSSQAAGPSAAGGDLGGSSSGLRAGRPAAPAAVAKAPRIEKVSPLSGPTRPGPHLRQVKKNNSLLYIGIALIGVIVIVVIVVMVMVLSNPTETEGKHKHGGSTAVDDGTAQHDGGGQAGTGEVSPKRVEGFLGIPLMGKRIVVSVDGASSMNDTFDFVRHGIYHAVDSLTPGQQLRVAVWQGTTVKMLPESGFVSKAGMKNLQKELEGMSPTGSSEAGECMKASMKAGGDQVIFVTAKYGLDPEAADGVIEAGAGKVRIDGVKIESADTPSPLEILANKTGGVYMLVGSGKLEQMSK